MPLAARVLVVKNGTKKIVAVKERAGGPGHG